MAANTTLDTLIALGDDQIASQFDVIFSSVPSAIGTDANTNDLALRMDQPLDLPQRTFGTYEVFYQGMKIVKTSVLDETDKTIQMTFRVDQGWKTYNALNHWYKAVFDENNGQSNNPNSSAEINNIQTTMTVYAYGANKVIKEQFVYKGVRIKGLDVNSFDPQSGDPLRVTCTFIYTSSQHSSATGAAPTLTPITT